MLHLYLLRAMRGTAEAAPETKLRTYADDWRLFAQGALRKATRDIVTGFVAAAGELQATGMVVSLTRSVILASGAGARAALRRATGALPST